MSVQNLEETFRDTLALLEDEDELFKIMIDNEPLHFPKCILKKHSKYFQALFDFNADVNEVKLLKSEISFDCAHTILSALGRETSLNINQSNAQELLLGSLFLHCSESESVCVDFIVSNLDISNAFPILEMSNNFGLKRLASEANKVIRNSLQTLLLPKIDADEILALSESDLQKILQKIGSLDTGIWILLGWIEMVKDQDQPYDLLTHFPIELLTSQKSIDALNELNPDLASQRLKDYRRLSLKEKDLYWSTLEEKLWLDLWPRIPIVCSSGCLQARISYYSHSQGWQTLTTKPQALKFSSTGSRMCVVQDSIYFVGGEGNERLWKYDIKDNSWKVISKCEQDERILPQVAASRKEEKIFVFGGYSSSSSSKMIETESSALVLDIHRDQCWQPICPMEQSRSGGEAICLDDKIFLFGGLSKTRQWVRNCEVYDIVKDEYESIGDLPVMVKNFSTTLIGDCIYFVGGLDPLTMETKSSVFSLNVTTKTWNTTFPSLIHPRHSCASFFDGTHFYAIGGAGDDLEQLSNCEKFNFEAQKWELNRYQLPPKLKSSMNAVVARLPVRLMENYGDLGRANVSYRIAAKDNDKNCFNRQAGHRRNPVTKN